MMAKWLWRARWPQIKYTFIPKNYTLIVFVGMRMGKIVAKIGLIMLLQKFNFECMDNRDLEHDTHSVTLVVKGGINLRISNRN